MKFPACSRFLCNAPPGAAPSATSLKSTFFISCSPGCRFTSSASEIFDGQNGSHWMRRLPAVCRFQRNIRPAFRPLDRPRRFHYARAQIAIGCRLTGRRWPAGRLLRDCHSVGGPSRCCCASSAIYGVSNPNIFAAAQTMAGPRAAGKSIGFSRISSQILLELWRARALTGLLVEKTAISSRLRRHRNRLPDRLIVVDLRHGPIEPVVWPS